MVNTRLTIDPSRVNTYSIGFDRMFDMMSGTMPTTSAPNYPPYNIVKQSDDKYTIEIAVAGFSKEEIEIETKENTLRIESKSRPEGDDDKEYLHKGISNRCFKKAFTISDDVIVNGASMKDGLLYIEMERIIPEEKKPRTVKIK
jgi:molecular chaperone IbpA